MKAFILAGGFATRLWPLTEKRAKPLLPLAGKPIISHLLDRVPRDIPVTVSTNASFEEDFRAWAKTLDRGNVTIRIEGTRKDDEKLGALGAVRAWIEEDNIDDDILLLTGDNYLGCSLEAFLGHRVPDEALLAAWDIGDPAKASAFGTVVLAEDGHRIAAFEEKPAHPRTSLISTGCSWIPRVHLPALVTFAKEHPDNVGGVFEEFLRRNIPVRAFVFREPWFDIGSFEAYIEATRALVGENVLRQEGVTIERTECEGSVVLGRHSRIEDSVLRDVVLFPDCAVTDCRLEDCILDEGCVLRGVDLRGKMLRAGTRLTRT